MSLKTIANPKSHKTICQDTILGSNWTCRVKLYPQNLSAFKHMVNDGLMYVKHPVAN